jgi:hypothetical protein
MDLNNISSGNDMAKTVEETNGNGSHEKHGAIVSSTVLAMSLPLEILFKSITNP